jgi:protein-disulfide isomerase
MSKFTGFAMIGLLLAGCATSKETVRQVLQENPELVFEAFEKDPQKFVEYASRATAKGRQAQARNQKPFDEAELTNPKKPVISPSRAVLGDRSAPIQVVMYSDFQCPFCTRGHETVTELMKRYPNKVAYTLKHIPLDGHGLALPAAKRFESIALQDHKKAFQFQNAVFEAGAKGELKDEKSLDALAKKVGADVKKMKAKLNDKTVEANIEADKAEGRAFELTGTPGFVVNGVTLKGAYPIDVFEQIIQKTSTTVAAK